MRRPIPTAKVGRALDDAQGLSSSEVGRRLERYGRNAIVETPRGGWRDIAADSLKDPMIWFLVATAALFAAVGDGTEALIMVAAIAPLVMMDVWLHRRTQASTRGLRSRLAERATVIRNGARTDVPAADVVPGDLAVVRAGDPFPADGVIVRGESLQADESVLTGEALPVRKRALLAYPPEQRDPAVDTDHWGFAGTRLLTGEALVRVVDTGGDTLYGEIVRSASGGNRARTPLQRSITKLVAALLAIAAALCLTLAWIRWRQGHGIVDALVSAATLAVAAIPEEFPVVFTFFLGVGVFRLARRHALVRRAVVVENIGRVTCICSDKTGTLTEGRIRVAHYLPADGVDVAQLRTVAALASRRDSADALDNAILEAGAPEPVELERVATFPFTEDRRRETGVFRRRSGQLVAAAKGAPEAILPACVLTELERSAWTDRVRGLAETGHKVIGCASRELAEDRWLRDEPHEGYRLAGLIACEDPVRDGVVDAVAQARDAGIRVIMITGDHLATAIAVAREAGICGASPNAIEGAQLAGLVAEERGEALARVDVIARALPAQKVALVRALQARGDVVAVTGDGVNDVPALQAADIGIAMGERGTRSAREVGAIVLLDDNFRTIVSAIAEGRQLFRNLRLCFAYLLTIHLPLVATATLIPLASYPLLYLPVHIVWLELIIHPAALLAFQEFPAHAQPFGLRHDGRFFGVREWALVGGVGVVLTALIVWGYERSLAGGSTVEHARAMALVTLVLASAALTAGLSGLRTRGARIVTAATAASALLLVQAPVLARALHLEPLHAGDWAIAALSGVLPGLLGGVLRTRSRGVKRGAA